MFTPEDSLPKSVRNTTARFLNTSQVSVFLQIAENPFKELSTSQRG